MQSIVMETWHKKWNIDYGKYSITANEILFLLFICSTAQSMRENMISSEDQYYKYCGIVLGNWDYSIENEKCAKLRQRSIYNEIKVCKNM